MSLLGENARLLAVLQPSAATIDTHGNATDADFRPVWVGEAPCHLRESALVLGGSHSQRGSSESSVTAVKETSLIVRLSQARNAAQLVLAGWDENATRVRVSDDRVTPTVRTFRVASAAVRAGGGSLVDSIRLSLVVET